MRNTFVDTIINEYKNRDDIFFISGDAGLGVFDEFQEKYPGNFLNMGIAEQNMASFSAGLAMTGYKVCLYNIIPFLLYRCYEQIRNDICYQRLPVVLIGIGSGVTYAPAGMSHYSVEDIGLARTLPNLSIISPIDPVEAKLAARYALESENPVYIRLAKRGEPNIHADEHFDITRPQVIKKGAEVAILFHGSISAEVMTAYDELTAKGIYPALISVPMIQPLNTAVLLEVLAEMKFVISIEEHFVNSGLGDVLANIYAECRPSWLLQKMGFPYQFIHEIEDAASMRKSFGVSGSNIVAKVESLLGQDRQGHHQIKMF